MSIRCFISSLVLITALLRTGSVCAQSYRLELSSNPLNFKVAFTGDSTRVLQAIGRIRNQYILNAYLECNADSISWGSGVAKAWMHIGPRYSISDVQIEADSHINTFQMLKSRYMQTAFDTIKLLQIADEILNYMENNGYPFCAIQAENRLTGAGVNCIFRIDQGPFFTFDTCHIDGDAIVKKSFIEAYTGIKKGSPYNEALFRKAHDKLNQLPFLFSERIPQLIFVHGGKAKPYYYLRKKRTDQVNGIIGLAPGSGSAQSGNSGNVVLTGEFALRLNNLFKSAKVLGINWKSFQARSQELKTYFSFPYLLSKPLGADVAVDLLKYDTLYTVFQRQLGFQYFTSGINGFKMFYKVSTTNLNSVDTAAIRTSVQFPSINAIELVQYGLMGSFNQLDYRFNPRKGYWVEASASVGSKTILRDNLISEVRFGQEQFNLYDSGVLKTTQYQYRLKADRFFAAGSRGTFRIGVYMNQIIAPRIFFNELEREGGINSLKGFNEQSIFASNFNMLELEYRIILGLNSHFRIFWNGAYYEDKRFGRQDQVFDFPWGFGAGGNIETGAGILTLIYALGKEKSNAFDLRAGKFHFGISSYF